MKLTGNENERREAIQIRVSATEKAGIKRAAAVAGGSMSSWLRDRVRRDAAAELRAIGEEVPFLKEKSQ